MKCANTNARAQRRKPSRASSTNRPFGARDFPVVGVGASAGGLEAFTQLLKYLPLDTGLGFVLVQHLDPQHESALTQLLARATTMPVREVTNNLRVEPNHVYVIPPNTNLTISQGVLKLQRRQRTAAPARSIDTFLASLAQDHRERAIGVILSGTASDGTLGLEAIKAEGGITFAQDDSAKYDSMPRSAVAAGCVDFILKPEDIAKELGRIARHPYVAGQPHELGLEHDRASATAHEGDETALPSGGYGSPSTGANRARRETEAAHAKPAENGLAKILLLLRNHSGVDFSLYKCATIQRRITRRIVLNKHNTMEQYATFLRGTPKELDALYSDVLISVTSFFRNPEAFESLKRNVFPRLLQQRSDDPFRVWVLGCSTGQEAYSIAMAFLEAADKAPRARKLQVFATDLNDALLDKARHGLYARSLAQDISPDRLRRFFAEEEGGYRIAKPLREMVVFARQNLISDPPFSRMDLISCRNLLIYLEASLQKKALPTFHYALKSGGFLFLGSSESISGFTDLFDTADQKHKIYVKKAASALPPHLPAKKERASQPSRSVRPHLPMSKPRDEPPEGLHGELHAQREADRLMVNQFAPPSVLITADLRILQFRGPTSAYLEPPTGKASFNVLKMAREGLILPLRTTINKAKKEHNTVRRENIRIEQNGNSRTINIEVIPLKNLREQCFLVLFEDTEKRPLQKQPRETTKSGTQTASLSSLASVKNSAVLRRNATLERELAEARDYLQSLQEQYEAANEELQASNEEVQSANEELQSVNEELETSKEELESSNEELTTVNEEMANRNTELIRLNADLSNLQSSTKLPIVLLGRDLTIRRFSAPAQKIFNLHATDVGRPLSDFSPNLLLPHECSSRGNEAQTRSRAAARERSEESQSLVTSTATAFPLEDFVREVIDTVREQAREVCSKEGRWYSLRARPYMTVDNKIDGAVIVLVDIDALKRTENQVRQARDYAEATIRTARDPLLILSPDLRVDKANDAFYKTFNVTPQQTEDTLIYQLDGGQWNIPKLRELLEDILPRNSVFNDFEVSHDFDRIGRRVMLLNARRLDTPTGLPEKILLGIEDITERQRSSEAAAKLAAIVESSDDAIISEDLNGIITSWNRGAERLFGYTDAEAIGHPVTMLVPPERLAEEPAILARIRRGEAIAHYETVRRRKDGTLLDLSLTVSPIKNSKGQIIGASKIARDITHRKKVEQALRESQALLADRASQLQELVAERTARLQDTIGELEHFSYTITHDMRAPLRAMQGFGGLLLNQSAAQLTPEDADYLRRIIDAASRMDALIRDSLQYAKVVREKIPLATVDPASVLRGILESYPTLQENHAALQIVEPLPFVIANETGLAQCFSNLLANAIKFVKPHKVPQVRIWAETRGDSVRFWFDDSGIGIPPEYQDRIFGMFQQLDKSYEGTGIGLALVRKTAERMNGKVGVESKRGKGSHFWLEFKKAGNPPAQ